MGATILWTLPFQASYKVGGTIRGSYSGERLARGFFALVREKALRAEKGSLTFKH